MDNFISDLLHSDSADISAILKVSIEVLNQLFLSRSKLIVFAVCFFDFFRREVGISELGKYFVSMRTKKS